MLDVEPAQPSRPERIEQISVEAAGADPEPARPGCASERESLGRKAYEGAFVTGGMEPDEAAVVFGVSKDSIRNWQARFEAGGFDALRSDRPGRQTGEGTKLTPSEEQALIGAAIDYGHRSHEATISWRVGAGGRCMVEFIETHPAALTPGLRSASRFPPRPARLSQGRAPLRPSSSSPCRPR
ncbi:helix-turn-helix domain-containing protein [Glycomyces arizonensis]|uniref:helix-turn-helix domain-containing protein n=1 Tax=Glycomyces arizonensis TaxID=256035 RepID=UPI000A07209B|nr:helix-turn-helix domain-containing protein [Glycomyces arizonensis]